MKTKTLFWLIAVLTFLSVSCDKNSPDGNNSEDNGNKTDKPLTELPALEETDDVCTKMDDIDFMAYCYENFDVNGDSKVSMIEANAVTTIECNNATSFAGLEYFTNIKSFKSSSVKTADFRYNKNLESIDCSGSDIESVDLRYNDKLTSISFSHCELLADVTLPDNLTSIGKSAFYDCSSLETVDASQCYNLEYISHAAFRFCPIKEFLLGTLNPPSLTTILDNDSFDYMPDAVLKVPAESVEAYKNSDWADYFGTIEAL